MGAIKRLRSIVLLKIARNVSIPNMVRLYLVKWGGVRISDVHNSYIGDCVVFDTLFPEQITIGNHVHITSGCKILTHSLETSKPGISWKKTKVIIEDDCFIGTNSIICNNVVIGKNSIIGAGSIVTKSVPPNEIWAGNPAKFVKNRTI